MRVVRRLVFLVAVMDFPATSLSRLVTHPHLRDVCFVELLNGGLLAYRDAIPAPEGGSSTN
jgi:hypothetical protein